MDANNKARRLHPSFVDLSAVIVGVTIVTRSNSTGRARIVQNQTLLVSSTSAVDKGPNETVITKGIGAIENAEENVEFSSRHSARQGSRKEPRIANSRSSSRRQIDEMELPNLRAEKEAEQLLRERQLELEQEREEYELRRRKEQQEQKLRLKLQQKKTSCVCDNMNESSKMKAS